MVQDGGHDLRAAEAVSSAGPGPLPGGLQGSGVRWGAGVGRRPQGGFLSPRPGAAGRVWDPRALPAFLAGRGRPGAPCRGRHRPGSHSPPASLRWTPPQRPQRGAELLAGLGVGVCSPPGALLPILFFFCRGGVYIYPYCLVEKKFFPCFMGPWQHFRHTQVDKPGVAGR